MFQKTLIYITADYGFDEGDNSHSYAPYIFLATDDKNVKRNCDEVDVAPTVYYGLAMGSKNFNPSLDGYPLQADLPESVIQARQNASVDNISPSKPSITSPISGANLSGTTVITFKVSDNNLSSVLLLIDGVLKADGPWTWYNNDLWEAHGAYDWDITCINTGYHKITILAFDEHCARNGPPMSTITVNVNHDCDDSAGSFSLMASLIIIVVTLVALIPVIAIARAHNRKRLSFFKPN